jgi:flagellar biosynthesis protein FlhG
MDPAVSLVARPAHARSRRIAIASGKGGVGKTWFAITLAQALAADGATILLFDGDLGLANVDIQLGLTPKHDLSGVLAGRIALEGAIAPVPDAGFDVLPGRSGSGSLAALPAGQMEAMLGALARVPYDVILLDLGAGLDAHTRRMAAWADTLLTVATDEPTSLTDAYAVLKLFAADRASGDARLVVNQAASQSAGRRTHETLAHACRTFLGRDLPLAGIVRRDEHVREAIRRQTPLLTRHPTCHAAAEVRAIARGLTGPHRGRDEPGAQG